jgi:hypothetical protein
MASEIARSQRIAMPARKTPKDDPDQHRRFIEAAREAEYSEDEAVFDEGLKRIAKVKAGTRDPAKSQSRDKSTKERA